MLLIKFHVKMYVAVYGVYYAKLSVNSAMTLSRALDCCSIAAAVVVVLQAIKGMLQ